MSTATLKTTELNTNATIYPILFAISFVHLLNDSMQAVIPAIFPILEESMKLSFTQLGWIAFTLNMTSSVMQPLVGWYTDKTTSPYILPFGMGASLLGMIGIAYSQSFWMIILSVIGIGLGSAVFHPEGSRVAYMAAGSRRGLAQSIYQVGGNTGSSLAPIMTALIFVPFGQHGAIWFTSLAAIAIFVLMYVSSWYSRQLLKIKKPAITAKSSSTANASIKRKVSFAIGIIIFLVFARSFYFSGISNFYQFYLIKDYGLTITQAQVYLFVYMAAGVLGTFAGGPIADRIGRKNLIFWSITGTAPLAIFLPHAGLWLIFPLLFLIGFIINTSFAVTVVYAQELLPGRIGMVSGLIVGLAFGMGALGSVVLGKISDITSITATMMFVSFLPLFGLFTLFLPNEKTLRSGT
ncbi:MFS transporter [Fictibacillus aquaticus]|uniref:MFS transporter n=1 Tax=Fictibacillus aquaticus TaxID=2021314 RepID=A0A235FD24_9BACL|nr:MFS transporter [Fictibacillus aquaticus]OYD59228.1 MFS transporter [Fictibacillus aquaticus]